MVLSFIIPKTTILKTLFSILFNPKAFLFKRLLINLLISSVKIIGLILSAFYFIVASITILLKFIILVLGKNLFVKVLGFIMLLFIKEPLIDFLRSNK